MNQLEIIGSLYVQLVQGQKERAEMLEHIHRLEAQAKEGEQKRKELYEKNVELSTDLLVANKRLCKCDKEAVEKITDDEYSDDLPFPEVETE